MSSPTTHTTFLNLIKKLLKLIDNYSMSGGAATDLTRSTTTTDQNTSGEIAGLCINSALHICYDLVKDSKYLQALPSTKFSSVINQDYIDLDLEPYLDEIEAITEGTNNVKLIRKSWSWYRKHYPDPSESTGNPIYYVRRNNRIYLAPRPNSVINYTVDFVKLVEDLVSDGDVPLLPSHYDYWIIVEAAYEWYKMEDPNSIPEVVVLDRADKREIATNAILSAYDELSVSQSHWNESAPNSYPYDSPIGS